jgi:GT2 family glycosyltransferase
MAIRVAPALAHGVQFDVNLPLYGWLEDIDFSRRMACHGRIVNCSSLLGVHLAIKRGRNSGVQFGYSQVANPLYLLRKGSMSAAYSLRHIAGNLSKNMLHSFKPEPWVDRRGRLKGNLMAMGDLFVGRLDPRRISMLR